MTWPIPRLYFPGSTYNWEIKTSAIIWCFAEARPKGRRGFACVVDTPLIIRTALVLRGFRYFLKFQIFSSPLPRGAWAHLCFSVRLSLWGGIMFFTRSMSSLTYLAQVQRSPLGKVSGYSHSHLSQSEKAMCRNGTWSLPPHPAPRWWQGWMDPEHDTWMGTAAEVNANQPTCLSKDFPAWKKKKNLCTWKSIFSIASELHYSEQVSRWSLGNSKRPEILKYSQCRVQLDSIQKPKRIKYLLKSC